MRAALIFALINGAVLFEMPAIAVSGKMVQVELSFQQKNTDLQMKVYELPLERGPDTGETKIQPLSEPFEKGRLYINGFSMKKGSAQPFLMVVENPSKETKYFFATSHQILPETAALGYRLGCLCNNHVFQIPPQSRWTRVGIVHLDTTAQGSQIRFIHRLIGLSKDEIEKKGLEKNVSTGN